MIRSIAGASVVGLGQPESDTGSEPCDSRAATEPRPEFATKARMPLPIIHGGGLRKEEFRTRVADVGWRDGRRGTTNYSSQAARESEHNYEAALLSRSTAACYAALRRVPIAASRDTWLHASAASSDRWSAGSHLRPMATTWPLRIDFYSVRVVWPTLCSSHSRAFYNARSKAMSGKAEELKGRMKEAAGAMMDDNNMPAKGRSSRRPAR